LISRSGEKFSLNTKAVIFRYKDNGFIFHLNGVC